MSFKRHLGLLASGLALLVAAVLPAFPAEAQQNTGNGLQISPTRTELQINPGEIKTFTIVVKNVTQAPISAKALLNDFESDGNTGEPKIKVDTNERTPNSLDKFLQGLTDVTLAPGESKEIKLTIDAPGDASPGAYYGAIRFTASDTFNNSDNTGDKQVTLNASVASLVLVEVSGNITEQIQVRSIQALGNGKPGSFFTKSPTALAVEIKNNGNSFSKPFGRVTITKGGKEVHSYEINNKEPRGNILPGSVRTFTDELKNVNKIGRYTADVSVSHGSGGQVITQKINFWYVPMWFILLLIALIIAIAIAGFILYKKKFKKRSRAKIRR